MDFKNIVFTQHAFTRMFNREVSTEAVKRAIRNSETIASYPDDQPYPSLLLLHGDKKEHLHIVAAFDEETDTCYVITVYKPDPELWNEDFRTRRKK
jgi:hypothetical protein